MVIAAVVLGRGKVVFLLHAVADFVKGADNLNENNLNHMFTAVLKGWI